MQHVSEALESAKRILQSASENEVNTTRPEGQKETHMEQRVMKKAVRKDGGWHKFETMNVVLAGNLVENATRQSKFTDDGGRPKQERVLAVDTGHGVVRVSCPTDLAGQMEDVPVGSYVEISWTGSKQTKGGLMRLFDVQFDDTTVVAPF